MNDTGSSEARWYEIRLQGHLEPRWATRFDDMTFTSCTDGTTLIRGVVIDQAALQGLLHQLRDTGLALVSVNQVGVATHPSEGQ